MTRPLSDLHRHIDGSLRESTLHELANARGLTVPADLRFHAGMGLDGALARFALTVELLQDLGALARVAGEICDDAARTNVTTLELRFAPQLHGDLARAIDAALDGIAGRAGLILCALYGDPPPLVDELVRLGAARRGVVAIDLAGGPSPVPQFRLEDYAGPFARARDAGLGRTVHAGEGRPPDEIRRAIELLHAQRIGHGTTLLDDPAVHALVVERAIAVEACPTSNVHTGAIPDLASHPLPRWLASGVIACVNTDNTLFSDVDAPAEHARARALPGMTDAWFAQLVANGHAAAFPRR